MQKLYCYVDESGQDTGGSLFTVCCTVMVSEDVRNATENLLQSIERTSRKRSKWQKTDNTVKPAFLRELLHHKSAFRGLIYLQHFFNTTDYVHATAEAISRSITKSNNIQLPAIIYIDGLSKHEVGITAVRIRRYGVKTEKVKGLTDEQSSLIRLSDAIAGFVRDYLEGQDYAKPFFKELLTLGIIIEI